MQEEWNKVFFQLALLPPLGHKEAISNSDESKLSWLEPKFELKDFKLEIKNRLKTSWNFDFIFMINYFDRIGLKMIKLCTV